MPFATLRLVVSPLAAAMMLAPKLGAFATAYPDVVLDVTTTHEMRLDLVAGHFDAGTNA
jgi:DNA-binding transcriptional LysR family regulator